MDGYSAAQIRRAEAPLLAQGLPLMARAAHALAEAVLGELAQVGAAAGPVLVLVGSGNNGGDALYAAAELCAGGAECWLLPVGSRLHSEGLAAALAAGAELLAAPDASEEDMVSVVASRKGRVRLIIDGVLGTGSAGRADLRGKPLAVVEELLSWNSAGLTVVAVDIPSGLDADTGQAAEGAVLPADLTVTFGGCKAGLLRGRGPELAGRIEVVDIGLLPALAQVEPLVRTR